MAQVRTLSSLSHPNVIRYLGTFHQQEHPSALCILTTYAEGGTLERAIASQAAGGTKGGDGGGGGGKEQAGGDGSPFAADQVPAWAAHCALPTPCTFPSVHC